MGMGRIPYFGVVPGLRLRRGHAACRPRESRWNARVASGFRHPAFPMCGSCPIGISASCLPDVWLLPHRDFGILPQRGREKSRAQGMLCCFRCGRCGEARIYLSRTWELFGCRPVRRARLLSGRFGMRGDKRRRQNAGVRMQESGERLKTRSDEDTKNGKGWRFFTVPMAKCYERQPG